MRATIPARDAKHDGLGARHVRRAVKRSGLHAFEAIYAPHSRLPDHEHAAPFFTYVLRGGYAERVGGVTRECERGSVIFHRGSESHANFVGSQGTASLNVEIAPSAWRELTGSPAGRRDIMGCVLGGDVEWRAFAVWREFHRDDAASALGMDEAVALLCAAVCAGRASGLFQPDRRLDRCAEYLAERLDTPPRLAEVAEIAGLHPMHLARIFRQRFGCSMGEFVRRRRVAWACEQLARGGDTIARVAVSAGFADHAHFTRTFRRITGCTPQWYSRNIRAD
jgi:AraC family transcriptional regulator